jgi:hypothetical protein
LAETFLILLAGGILLSAAVSDPKQVTLNWLRLCGIIALALTGLSWFFFARREPAELSGLFFRRISIAQIIATGGLILAQLGFVQVAMRRAQRILAMLGFMVAVLAGTALLHDLMLSCGTAVYFSPKPLAILLQAAACAGVASVTGLALMDMLLGHAYLTASQMTIQPFLRLNRVLAGALTLRALLAGGLVWVINARRPVDMLWEIQGLLIGTRYLVGFLVAGIFVYMADDCIRRRSTQSATGILYVCGVLAFIGEILGLYLTRETGLPF